MNAEARALHASAAVLCASVLIDSAVEHYRGSFENVAMFAPLGSSAVGLAIAGEAAARAHVPRPLRSATYAVAIAVGIAGLAFHAYNVLRQPGGWRWLNIFYAAPVGAPAALGLAGALGLAADSIASQDPDIPARLAGLPAGRALCALVAAGLAGTVGEAGVLHYRGSFHNPLMWLPISLPPIAAAVTAKAALETPRRRTHRLARWWLRLTALLGIVGVGLHAYGVSRAMGGWRNWQQNLVDGPPLPAPPSFSALAYAALAGLDLRERDGE